jgi:hypothetical protein
VASPPLVKGKYTLVSAIALDHSPLFFLFQLRKAKSKFAFLVSILVSQRTAPSSAEFFSRLLQK